MGELLNDRRVENYRPILLITPIKRWSPRSCIHFQLAWFAPGGGPLLVRSWQVQRVAELDEGIVVEASRRRNPRRTGRNWPVMSVISESEKPRKTDAKRIHGGAALELPIQCT